MYYDPLRNHIFTPSYTHASMFPNIWSLSPAGRYRIDGNTRANRIGFSKICVCELDPYDDDTLNGIRLLTTARFVVEIFFLYKKKKNERILLLTEICFCTYTYGRGVCIDKKISWKI